MTSGVASAEIALLNTTEALSSYKLISLLVYCGGFFFFYLAFIGGFAECGRFLHKNRNRQSSRTSILTTFL